LGIVLGEEDKVGDVVGCTVVGCVLKWVVLRSASCEVEGGVWDCDCESECDSWLEGATAVKVAAGDILANSGTAISSLGSCPACLHQCARACTIEL
jgi:hypothetical protein